MLRPAPTSTLFPYTTLFRSMNIPMGLAALAITTSRQLAQQRRRDRRSEEHTSELQSRSEFVWRRLLEKQIAPCSPLDSPYGGSVTMAANLPSSRAGMTTRQS